MLVGFSLLSATPEGFSDRRSDQSMSIVPTCRLIHATNKRKPVAIAVSSDYRKQRRPEACDK